jgi:hypothetical protein
MVDAGGERQMIAIVCGGRDYQDAARVRRVLDAAVDKLGLDAIIEGGATGADRLALDWAQTRGDIIWIDVPADWDGLGKAAGHIRNAKMLRILQGGPRDQERAVIAFPGGVGTDQMCSIAARASIRIIRA